MIGVGPSQSFRSLCPEEGDLRTYCPTPCPFIWCLTLSGLTTSTPPNRGHPSQGCVLFQVSILLPPKTLAASAPPPQSHPHRTPRPSGSGLGCRERLSQPLEGVTEGLGLRCALQQVGLRLEAVPETGEGIVGPQARALQGPDGQVGPPGRGGPGSGGLEAGASRRWRGCRWSEWRVRAPRLGRARLWSRGAET